MRASSVQREISEHREGERWSEITLKVYAHLFDRAAHAERARSALEKGYGKPMESSSGDRRRLALVVEMAEVASLRGVGD